MTNKSEQDGPTRRALMHLCMDNSSLSDHLAIPTYTASIAEAKQEVLKAVAEAKAPQKKGPYIKLPPKYRAKVAKFPSIIEIAYSKGIVIHRLRTSRRQYMQHFSNKPRIKLDQTSL